MQRSRSAALFLVALIPAVGVAQRSEPPLAEWQHTEWTGDAGPPRPFAEYMGRSSDGYMWLAAAGGLIRFDGVRFTFVDSVSAPQLEAGTEGEYYPEFTDKSGAMWVRGPNGLCLSYRDGRFHVEIARGSHVNEVEEDGAGRLWVVTDYRSGARLSLLVRGALIPAPLPPGVPDSGVVNVKRDTGSGMWIGTFKDGLWHVTGASAEHYGTGVIRPVRQTSDGTLWANSDVAGTIQRLVDGKWYAVHAPGAPYLVVRDVIEGPDGSIWLPTNTTGVFRWRHGVLDHFTRKDGLSSDFVTGMLLGDGGAVWIATAAGLDRIRPTVFMPVDSRAGLPDDLGQEFMPDVSGAIWIRSRSADSLVLLDGGVIRRQPGPVIAKKFPSLGGSRLILITPSHAGGAWVAPLEGGLVHYTTHGTTTTFGKRDGFPSDEIEAGVEMRDGSVWTTALTHDLGRLRNGRYRDIDVPFSGIAGNSYVEDGLGRLWLGFTRENSLLVLVGDSIAKRVPLPARDSVHFRSLALEGGDTLWAAGADALFRIVDDRAVAVPAPALKNLLTGNVKLAVSDGQLWIAGAAGVARLSLSTLYRAADGESLPIKPKLFGPLDGLSGGRAAPLVIHPIQVAPDGRVWIVTPTGLAVADPAVQYTNRIAPRVHIEDMMIGGKAVPLSNGETIPPNPQRVEIRFSAPMLGLPERGRIEYRLDGADSSWIDSKPPHVAVYNQLRPGRYRFRVRAWNEDGVPSAGEAALRFRVLPAWYQAWWFFALGILAIAALSGGAVAIVQRRRSRRAALDAQARFDAVLAERTRVARELHDTLLQGFTGITLQLDGVRDRLEARAEPSASVLGDILRRADRTLREAREMVWDMRQPGSDADDLGESLRVASRELTQPGGVELRHSVEGAPRPLPPMVVTTILRIAKEAVTNAMKHAKPSAITVRLRYEPRRVVLEIADDGVGADPASMDTATERGHWGVAGMRERARAAGGTIEVTSAPGEGTHIEVSLPAEPT